MSSKQAVSVTPALDHSGAFRDIGVRSRSLSQSRLRSSDKEKGGKKKHAAEL